MEVGPQEIRRVCERHVVEERSDVKHVPMNLQYHFCHPPHKCYIDLSPRIFADARKFAPNFGTPNKCHPRIKFVTPSFSTKTDF